MDQSDKVHSDPSTRLDPPKLSKLASTISSGPSLSIDDMDDIDHFRCCWNACHVGTGLFAIALFETLLLFHSVIFLAIYLAHGETKYSLYVPLFSMVIRFAYFIPLITLQSLWIIGNMLVVLAVKMTAPVLMMVQFLLRLPALSVHVVVATLLVVNAAKLKSIQAQRGYWALVLTITVFVFVIVASVYFTYVMWISLVYMRKCRRNIAAQRSLLESTKACSDESARSGKDKFRYHASFGHRANSEVT